jgi:hypothetical protein
MIKNQQMKLVLNRTYYLNGTNGDLLLDREKVCSTIELPWKNNKPRVSCIPEGEYELRKRWSQRFGEHFILLHVPGRSYILIHPANDALKELKGCIAPVSLLIGEGKGSGSRPALNRLKKIIDHELKRGNKIFLNIQTKTYEHRDKEDEQTHS